MLSGVVLGLDQAEQELGNAERMQDEMEELREDAARADQLETKLEQYVNSGLFSLDFARFRSIYPFFWLTHFARSGYLHLVEGPTSSLRFSIVLSVVASEVISRKLTVLR